MHSGLGSRFLIGSGSVLLYVVKVTESSVSFGTMCNGFSMENASLLYKVLPDSALDKFTTMALHSSQMFQYATWPITDLCAGGDDLFGKTI